MFWAGIQLLIFSSSWKRILNDVFWDCRSICRSRHLYVCFLLSVDLVSGICFYIWFGPCGSLLILFNNSLLLFVKPIIFVAPSFVNDGFLCGVVIASFRWLHVNAIGFCVEWLRHYAHWRLDCATNWVPPLVSMFLPIYFLRCLRIISAAWCYL